MRRESNDATFDALGSPVRREILRLLSDQPLPVGELARRLPVSRPAVSKHLRLLEHAGLVACRSAGTRNVYRLEARGFEAARGWLDRFWNEAIARFRWVAENVREEGAKDSDD
jgi:DNA-binding transcriptional ArsR family regulator